MVLCFFSLISETDLFIAVNSTSGFVILALNVNAFAVYFKLNGLPYKSRYHFLQVQKVSIVCTVWTVAYIIKVFAVKYGTNYLLNDPDTTVSTQAAFGVWLTYFLTLIVPFYCLCDYEFVKTLAAKHLISEGE